MSVIAFPRKKRTTDIEDLMAACEGDPFALAMLMPCIQSMQVAQLQAEELKRQQREFDRLGAEHDARYPPLVWPTLDGRPE